MVEVVADGDTIVARFRCAGTQTGGWLGLPATRRRMRIDDVYFLRIENGRIARLWGLENTRTRTRQLGGGDARLGELGSRG